MAKLNFDLNIYKRAPPLTNSVIAKATKPTMAALPFQTSASGFQKLSDVAPGPTPIEKGINDATVKRMLVRTNHIYPPLAICVNKSWPLKISTTMADTNPIIANLPFILSGAGP